MKIQQEWVMILIDKGFSAAGATDTAKDLRKLNNELSDIEFGQWLKSLSLKNILALVGQFYKRTSNKASQQVAL